MPTVMAGAVWLAVALGVWLVAGLIELGRRG